MKNKQKLGVFFYSNSHQDHYHSPNLQESTQTRKINFKNQKPSHTQRRFTNENQKNRKIFYMIIDIRFAKSNYDQVRTTQKTEETTIMIAVKIKEKKKKKVVITHRKVSPD